MQKLSPHSRALILPGGGARAAYQVGVLKAVAEITQSSKISPFRVYSGTSAGAINSSVLASHAQDFQLGMHHLEGVWNNFTVDQVYKTDALTVLKNTAHWIWTILTAGRLGSKPTSLFDNDPLRQLLKHNLRFDGVAQSIKNDLIDGLVIVCSAYGSAQSINFFQAKKEQMPWQRFRRIGYPTELSVEHLMASAAIPYVFPAVKLGSQYFADGAVRQAKPLSAALHLGADRLLVIGVRDERPNQLAKEEVNYPSLGKIAGYILDTLFMDGLFTDLEHLLHVNRLLENFPQEAVPEKPISTHVIVPSLDIREIALRHQHHLPRSVRMFMAGSGGSDKATGSQLVSYLLFDKHFTHDLIALGYEDAIQQKDVLSNFFYADKIPTLVAPDRICEQLSHSM